jgi:hypothetical protein
VARADGVGAGRRVHDGNVADDDIERLLREVEGALGDGGQAARPPARRDEPDRGPEQERLGPVGRARAGLPASVAVGAVAGGVVGFVFAILPFVDSLSGALGAFVGAAGVSVAGRMRGRRG